MSKLVKSLLGGSLAVGLCSAAAPQADAALFYALTESTNQLVLADHTAPSDVINGYFVAGLNPGEILAGIDYNPSTGVLYGLGRSSQVYTIAIDSATGARATAMPNAISPILNGSSFGFDFNPTNSAARIRVVSNQDQNLRINSATGAVTNIDPAVFYPGDALTPGGTDPGVIGSAYTNNLPGAATTTLYGIDSVNDQLVTQNPTTGALTTVAKLRDSVTLLPLDITDRLGFDILSLSPTDNTAYAALVLKTSVGIESASSLYRIDLTTGTATNLGTIAGGEYIRGLALVPVPEPASFGLLAGAAALLAGRRRRKA